MLLSWNSSETAFGVALGSVVICFTAHWIITKRNYVSDTIDNLRTIMVQRYSGLILLGIVPALAMFLIAGWVPEQYGLAARMETEGWVWLACLAVPFVLAGYFVSPSKDNLARYPQVRNKQWSRSTFVHEYSSWLLYLIGYETLFRGILLFGSLSVMSAWSAICLMAVVNTLSHIPKGKRETIASLPASILFGYITLRTGSIWVACLLHWIMAVSVTWFSFRAHPDMHFARKS